MDMSHWPRCLLRHGWLPMLSGANGASRWAGDASESAAYLVEAALGDYSSRMVSDWSPPVGYDRVGTGGGSPWADSADDAAVYMLESYFGFVLF